MGEDWNARSAGIIRKRIVQARPSAFGNLGRFAPRKPIWLHPKSTHNARSPGDRRGLRIMRIVEAKLLEHPLEHDEQRGERQRDDGHEVDEDVHGRAGGILERIATVSPTTAALWASEPLPP